MDRAATLSRASWLLAAGVMLGAAILGVGGRLAMRLIAILTPAPEVITPSGTLTVIAMGAASGAGGALLHAAAHALASRAAPSNRWLGHALFGAALALVTARGLHGSPPLPSMLFVPVVAAFAVVFTRVASRPPLRFRGARLSATRVLALWAVAAAVPTPAAAQSRAALPVWLAGCWERRSGATLVEEQWLVPRGGMMLGMGRTTRGDSVVDFEHTRIYTRGDTLVYAAAPAGQPPAEFRAVAPAAGEIRFENLAHDFPQRVIYRRAGPDSVVARVEGMRGGQLRGRDFAYGRAACPGRGGAP